MERPRQRHARPRPVSRCRDNSGSGHPDCAEDDRRCRLMMPTPGKVGACVGLTRIRNSARWGHCAPPTVESSTSLPSWGTRLRLASSRCSAVFVAGFPYHAGPKLIDRLNVGDLLRLVREHDNPHDTQAVAIYYQPRGPGRSTKVSRDSSARAPGASSSVSGNDSTSLGGWPPAAPGRRTPA